MAVSKQKKCFVICPIGEKGTETRAWSDDVYSHLIEPITKEFGYDANRIIDESRPGEITAQIVEEIYTSELVIADLSGMNPNVFYELALRHSTGKPFVHMSDNTSKIPFDILALNAIEIRPGSFAGAEATKDELRKQIQAIESGAAAFDNPVSRYQEKVRIEAEGKPADRELYELSNQVARLARDVENLKPRPLTIDQDIGRFETRRGPSSKLVKTIIEALGEPSDVSRFKGAALGGLNLGGEDDNPDNKD